MWTSSAFSESTKKRKKLERDHERQRHTVFISTALDCWVHLDSERSRARSRAPSDPQVEDLSCLSASSSSCVKSHMMEFLRISNSNKVIKTWRCRRGLIYRERFSSDFLI